MRLIIVVVFVVCECKKSLFRFGLSLDMKGRGLGGSRSSSACALLLSGTLLPLKDPGPVGELLLIKFLLPVSFGVFTIFAIVTTFVASRAVVSLNIIIKLTLEFGSYFLAVDDGFQVRYLEPFGEFGGLFMFRAAGEMGSVLGRFAFLIAEKQFAAQ